MSDELSLQKYDNLSHIVRLDFRNPKSILEVNVLPAFQSDDGLCGHFNNKNERRRKKFKSKRIAQMKHQRKKIQST